MQKKGKRAASVALVEHDIRGVDNAEEMLRNAKTRLADSYVAHTTAFPPTKRQKDRILTHVADGGTICCEPGAEWLRSVVDPIWARLLNTWAYEELSGCGHHRREEDIANDMTDLKVVLEDGFSEDVIQRILWG